MLPFPRQPDGGPMPGSMAFARHPHSDMPDMPYVFPPAPSPYPDTLDVPERRHARSHTAPGYMCDPATYFPPRPAARDLRLLAPNDSHFPSSSEPSAHPDFSQQYQKVPQQQSLDDPHRYGVGRPVAMRRTLSHNPPGFPSFPYLSTSTMRPPPPGEGRDMSTHPLVEGSAVTTRPVASGPVVGTPDPYPAFTSSNSLPDSSHRLPWPYSGFHSSKVPGSSYYSRPPFEVPSFPGVDLSSDGVRLPNAAGPRVISPGGPSSGWTHAPTLELAASSSDDPPYAPADALIEMSLPMLRLGSDVSNDSSSLSTRSASTGATSATVNTVLNPLQPPERGGSYGASSDCGSEPLTPPQASLAGPIRSGPEDPASPRSTRARSHANTTPVKRVPRPPKPRKTNRNVQLPPPQALLAPGVVAPSAGAIAAVHGRGTALFPGTNSPALPTDEDYGKMVTKSSRGRHARVMADLRLDPDEANNPAAAPTFEAMQFAGFTKTGKPKRVYVCKAPGCARVFKRSEHLKRHVRSIHTYEKRKSFQLESPYHLSASR